MLAMHTLCQSLDGSPTIYVKELDEHYHSTRGALSEALHVYIGNGLDYLCQQDVFKGELRVLEMGLGTGLNAVLSRRYAIEHHLPLYYESIEKYPLSTDEITTWLQASKDIFQPTEQVFLTQIHSCQWEFPCLFPPYFTFVKRHCDLSIFRPLQDKPFHIIYFDAFGPDKQPHLWTTDIFGMLYHNLSPGGIIVTYASKGLVKQALRNSGFLLERIPGACGKRHMLRATKPKD